MSEERWKIVATHWYRPWWGLGLVWRSSSANLRKNTTFEDAVRFLGELRRDHPKVSFELRADLGDES